MDTAKLKLNEQIKNAILESFTSDAVKTLVESTEKAADSDTGTFDVIASTEDVDRMNEIIKQDGWQLDHFMKNPVILWGHSHFELPIGVATSVNVEEQNGRRVLRIKGKFASHAFAQTVRQLYDEGVLRTVSVGFIEKEREGNVITMAELIELSFVSVPANPNALTAIEKMGLDIADLVSKGIFNEIASIKTADEVEQPEEEETDENEETEEKEDTEDTPDEVEETAADENAETEDGEGDGVPEEEQTEETPETEESKSITIEMVYKELLVLKDIVSGQEPAGDEPQDEDAPESEPEGEEEDAETKRFLENREVVQKAATILGDVLAAARKRSQEIYKENNS